MALIDIDKVPLAAFALQQGLDPGPGALHTHQRHQLLYASRGTLRLMVGERSWTLPPQRAAWIAAGTPHAVALQRPAMLQTIYFDEAFVPWTPPACEVFSVDVLARQLIVHCGRWGPERPQSDALALAVFNAVAHLSEEWVKRRMPLSLPRGTSEPVQRCIRWTLDNLENPITARDASRAARLSLRSLQRHFVAEAGESWKHFLIRARMFRAIDLLAEPGATVSQVAYASGYNSLSTFSRLFTEICGESPSAWRSVVQERST